MYESPFLRVRHAARFGVALVTLLLSFGVAAVPLTLSKLTGLTGGTIAGTAVYKADLSSIGLANIQSISVSDNSSGLGGAAGQFSGFDFDAIKLSTTDCADAACAKAAAGLSAFDFISGVLYTPGAQRAPVDPKLFGTNAAGTGVDNLVATLGLFDAEATTAIPGAFGFVSMGDNGILSFNLTSLVATSGLFMYLGEVGDNGEVAASNITVSETRATVPSPDTLALAALGLLGLAALRTRRA